MKPHTTKRFLLGLPLLALAGCSSMAGLFGESGGKGLNLVDDLLDRVEGVHVEAVLSRERIKESLSSLYSMVSPDFDGDPLEAYTLFEDAVQKSKEQARELDRAVEPMKQVADDVFARWSKNLEGISNQAMRQHSQTRLEETRRRYQAILDAVEPARVSYLEFNTVLSDHALFLKNDFNASSVAEIEQEVVDLVDMARKLDVQFVATQDAAQAYVRSTALRGQEQLSRSQARVRAVEQGSEEVMQGDTGR